MGKPAKNSRQSEADASLARAEAMLFKPPAQPAPTSKRDPKQEAQAREEARRESRAQAAAERSQALAVGVSTSDVPSGTDLTTVCGRISLKKSIQTIARELGCGAGKLAAWLLHPDHVETYNAGLRGFAHNCATEIIEIADDLTIDAADKRVMIETREWAAKTMGREFYGDKVQVQTDVRVQHVVDSSALDPEQRDELRRILRLAIEQARDQGRVIEHDAGWEE